jgi:hypothetical protein
MKYLLPEVNTGCEWVLAGEGVATRKYDGTCVMFDGSRWWARREVKPNKTQPPGFQAISTDDNTGKTVGWEPVEQSGFAKWHTEALNNQQGSISGDYEPGTYELCGPKVQGNPEQFDQHVLILHKLADVIVDLKDNLTFESLAEFVTELHTNQGFEGIVWHHPDGRMAKLKARDFPLANAMTGNQRPEEDR